jgi:nicotinate dehydrogenase subunit B
MCHESTGLRFSAKGIPLAVSKVIALPDPRNLIHVVLEGIPAPPQSPAASMPGFASAMTDTQVVALVRYLRSSFSNQPPWKDVETHVRKERSKVIQGGNRVSEVP